MKTSFNDICHEVSFQRSEHATIKIAVVDDPKSASEEIVNMGQSEIVKHRYAWDEKANRMLPSYPNLVYSRKDDAYYAIIDKREHFDDKAKLVWDFVVKACYGKSERFNRQLFFAKLLVAAFGKEALDA